MGPRRAHRMAIVALLAAACAGPTGEAPARDGGALAAEQYADRLAAAAGGPLSVARLGALAAESAGRIEERMDSLAARRGAPAGWRPLFEALRRQTPADEPAVLEAYRAELARAAAWVAERDLFAAPPPPPEVVVLENPSLRAHFPLAIYHDGRFAVTTAPAVGGDPAYLRNHCRVCIPPLAVHEGIPGHHLAFARMAGADGAAPSVAALARHKPYVEGWALYAELLMLENGYYAEPERELGAWRLVLLRLLRAEVDAGLHGGGLSPAAAGRLYRERLLLGPAAAAAEVRAHLAKPTVKASYLLGLLQILELREAFRAAHPDALLGEFHDRLLGPPAPLPRIADERFGVRLGPPGEAVLPWPFGVGRTDPGSRRESAASS